MLHAAAHKHVALMEDGYLYTGEDHRGLQCGVVWSTSVMGASKRLGEGGEIFVLNMGEPVKILDLARNMIVLKDV